MEQNTLRSPLQRTNKYNTKRAALNIHDTNSNSKILNNTPLNISSLSNSSFGGPNHDLVFDESSSVSLQTDTNSNSSIYDSALENITNYSEYLENSNDNAANDSNQFDATLNADRYQSDDSLVIVDPDINLVTSENTSVNEDVDPKSNLANKTIFKTDNPNLSIIEINENPINKLDIKKSVVVIGSPSIEDSDKVGNKKTIKNNTDTVIDNEEKHASTQRNHENPVNQRKKRAESLIHSSKQKLDIKIAEASAMESNPNAHLQLALKSTNHTEQCLTEQQDTKREIIIYETIEEFEENLPSTVKILDTPFGSKVYLVGTAHFSEESQDDVSFVIRNVRPDIVMVELCPSRIHILKLDEKTLLEEAKNFNMGKIRNIIQAHGYINGIFFILLLQMSAQIAKDLGMAPGGEFRRAFEEVHKLPGCMLHLGDRPIRVTLHRALRALSLWQTMKLVWRLTSTETISIEEVEECKQRDLLEKLMQEMAGEFPAFSDVFVKERDIFLCHSLQLASMPQVDAAGETRPVRVVGVVGIGHANGIANLWGMVDPHTIPNIMDIPPASPSTRMFQYTVKYGLIGLTLFGVYKFMRPRLGRFF